MKVQLKRSNCILVSHQALCRHKGIDVLWQQEYPGDRLRNQKTVSAVDTWLDEPRPY